MREILFRGLFDKSKLGNDDLKECFIYGDLIQTSHESIIRERDTNIEWIVHKDSVGQYTGLNDKNGKKIFEGDIVEIGKLGAIPAFSVKICFKNGYFYGEYANTPIIYFMENYSSNLIEVIGNIHDNPELLDVK